MKIYIYQIWFPTSKKYYIGQTCNIQKRMHEHLRAGSVICKALWKYDDWQVAILHTCKSRDEANRIEIEEIRNFNSVAPNGYNLTRGGEGTTHCEITKEKIRNARRGTHASKETKKKMREAKLGKNNHFYGKHHTEESNEKNRKLHEGKTLEERGHKFDCNCSVCKAKRGEAFGKDNPMFGKKRLDTIKRNINNNPMKNSAIVLKGLRTKLIHRIAKLESE
ncbi:MAG: NUMOD3 domain-containing DNA-binding protein [Nitrosopumilus sp.]